MTALVHDLSLTSTNQTSGFRTLETGSSFTGLAVKKHALFTPNITSRAFFVVFQLESNESFSLNGGDLVSQRFINQISLGHSVHDLPLCLFTACCGLDIVLLATQNGPAIVESHIYKGPALVMKTQRNESETT